MNQLIVVPPTTIAITEQSTIAEQRRPYVPALLSIDDLRVLTGLGRTTVYSLIKRGQLDVCRIGRRTLVKTESVADLINRCTVQGGL